MAVKNESTSFSMTPMKKKTTWLIFLALLNLIVIATMQSFGSSLEPYSIIAFEFAGSVEKSNQIVSTWSRNGVLDSVYFLIGFDYLFMVTYSAFLWLACAILAPVFTGTLSKVFLGLSFIQPIAALFDAIENLALYKIIAGSGDHLWPFLAVLCAVPKFAMVASAVLACFLGAGYLVVKPK